MIPPPLRELARTPGFARSIIFAFLLAGLVILTVIADAGYVHYWGTR